MQPRSMVFSDSTRSGTGGPAGVGETTLSVARLNKTFSRATGETFKAIDDVSIDVKKGELVVLLGPSGCGKTTLLRAVAGLETPDSGSIRLGDRVLFDSVTGLVLPPEARHVGMVFQSYALWPHMTVAQNVAYPLRMRGVGRAERDRRVADILAKMRIGDLAQQHPGRISGGQQQRVALARALVCGDGMILFDEPLSNVDAKVRELLRLEILAMQRDFGFTALYVTHDQEEAMALASRIAVVGRGRIEQLGTPEDVYARPVSLGVARFIGSANELAGRIVAPGVVETAVGRLSVAPAATEAATGPEVIVLTRPEHWRFAADGEADAMTGTVAGTVVGAAFLGSVSEHVVALDAPGAEPVTLVIRGPATGLRRPGTNVRCRLSADGPLVFARDAA